MGSLFKKYSDTKLNGRVYTPSHVVDKILDDAGYCGMSILGKPVLDPACGDGQFLEAIAKRIIKSSDLQYLAQNLSKITGWDINEEVVIECKERLDDLVNVYGLKVNWNISVNDALKKFTQQERFDYIFGNPPYIRIQHLEPESRRFIQHHFSFCKNGSTDIYIAFFELCNRLLTDDGTCGLITPNTFLYTDTASYLRKTFSLLRNVKQITNYGEIQLFKNATTYSAITIFNKAHNPHFIYQRAKSYHHFAERAIDYEEVEKEKVWGLSIYVPEQRFKTKLKDIADVTVGLTTLCDKAYIFSALPGKDDYAVAFTKLKGEVKVEKAILKPIIKASKIPASFQSNEYILFPYEMHMGKYRIIKEEYLKIKFPFAYKYLRSVKSFLDRRDNGVPNQVAWYAFGRTQSLNTSFGIKILFSPMNERPKFILSENREATFYSGYCIKFMGNYSALLKQLNSRRMEEYISVSSRDFRGGWKAYNKKIIQEFEIDMEAI